MNILLVGCGRMGSALAGVWLRKHRLLVFDPAVELPLGAERIEWLDRGLPPDLVLVIAVKPQAFSELAKTLAAVTAARPLVISIMAGVNLAALGEVFGSTDRIVRAMPNTPAAFGKGITAAIGGAEMQPDDAAVVEALLEMTGEIVWLGDEAELDVVTALSGSGPAYFFRFAEALATAGAIAGLEPDLAMKLAHATFIGAAALAEVEQVELADLRRRVTSPGGTTFAGLSVMNEGNAIDCLAEQVIAAAATRSRELAN